MLLWVGVAVVAVSLLAMHQSSASHTAAGPITPNVASSDGPGSHTAADIGSSDHMPGSDSHSVDQSYAGGAVFGGGPSTPIDSDCPGCGAHQTMALTCLVALTSLAVGWLLARPTRWRRLLPRYSVRGFPQDVRCLWQRPPSSLVELSISRT